MTRIVHVGLDQLDDALIVLSMERRAYAAASHDGSYFHLISPSQVDAIDVDGNVTRPAGFLACICKGFLFHGTCYRTKDAEALEAGQADRLAAPAWMQGFDAPVGAGEMVEASRG